MTTTMNNFDAMSLPLDQHIFVTGERGVGKTVLLQQLAARAKREHASTLVLGQTDFLASHRKRRLFTRRNKRFIFFIDDLQALTSEDGKMRAQSVLDLLTLPPQAGVTVVVASSEHPTVGDGISILDWFPTRVTLLMSDDPTPDRFGVVIGPHGPGTFISTPLNAVAGRS